MALWSLSVFFALMGLHSLLPSGGLLTGLDLRKREKELLQVIDAFHELQETLQAGLVPEAASWNRLRGLALPWGELAVDSILGLRAQGGAILPTLTRLRDLAESSLSALKDSRARSSQAIVQAFVCSALVPLFGTLLYWILPGLEERSMSWISACLIAIFFAALGAVWLFRLAEAARWGGLSPPQRGWMLLAQCSGERFLALLRSGDPADIAWRKAVEFLEKHEPDLAFHWGSSVWSESADPGKSSLARSPVAQAIVETGLSLKKSVQVSLMEGRSCSDRVESSLASLRHEMRSHVEKEVSLLGTRALKPLFICVAPALFGMLVYGLFLGWKHAASGVFG